MRTINAVLAIAALAAPVACSPRVEEIPSWRGPSFAHQLQLVREAEAFIDDYARRLLAGDRAAIAALYDPAGVILVRDGRRIGAEPAEITRLYAADSWQPPKSIEWSNLHFEAVGPEAVVVLGNFDWGESDGEVVRGAYHALLRREDGRFFIRIEDEAVEAGAR